MPPVSYPEPLPSPGPGQAPRTLADAPPHGVNDSPRGRGLQDASQEPLPPPGRADERSDATGSPALEMDALVKTFGRMTAVDRLSLTIPAGSFYGIVGPNGAGKTTTLSMATGLLRPDAGRVLVHGADVWADPLSAKARLGVLPDGLRTFDRLNGLELVTYAGLLRGLVRDVVVPRATELIQVLGLWEAGTTLVADYSAGMRKKVHLACAMVHSPSVLVLDEPFESVDPVSAQTIQAILRDFAAAGGTVVVSSHVMAVVERLCDHVAIISAGRVVAAGTTSQVAAGATLEERFTQLVGAEVRTEGLAWLRPSSD